LIGHTRWSEWWSTDPDLPRRRCRISVVPAVAPGAAGAPKQFDKESSLTDAVEHDIGEVVVVQELAYGSLARD
jgi:hypothetical protein